MSAPFVPLCVENHSLTHRAGYKELQAYSRRVMAGDHEYRASTQYLRWRR